MHGALSKHLIAIQITNLMQRKYRIKLQLTFRFPSLSLKFANCLSSEESLDLRTLKQSTSVRSIRLAIINSAHETPPKYTTSSFGHFSKENEKQFQHLPFDRAENIVFFLLSLFFFRTSEMNATMCVHISMWHTTVSQTHSFWCCNCYKREQPMIWF